MTAIKALWGGLVVAAFAAGSPVGASPALRPFVDPLPIPAILRPQPGPDGVDRLSITEIPTQHRFHRDLPLSAVWAYDGQVPGPTIEAAQGRPLRIHWLNRLPPQALLPVTLPPPAPGDCGLLPEARTVTHLHGALVKQGNFMDARRNDDGFPDAWSVPGQDQEAFYPGQQAGALLWYHDHALGCTARNVAAGLAGLFILRGPSEAALGLPSGPHELPLLLQARGFHDDGGLDWPSKASAEEVYGDVATVNGAAWPYLRVEACRYRFRMLNASTSRLFDLRWRGPAGPAPSVVLIGSDQGLLEAPVDLGGVADGGGAGRCVVGPGERVDVVVDFSAVPGSTWVLGNASVTDPAEPALPDIMQFRVGGRPRRGAPGPLPSRLSPAEPWPMPSAERNIFFTAEPRQSGPQRMLLNGLPWGAPVVERAVAGSVERWNLLNATAEWHSFHIHGARLRVEGRQDLDRTGDGEASSASGQVRLPKVCEAGVKDTVMLPPAALTRVLIRFGPYVGRYLYHCHMLEHEDDDMMRPYEIVAAP